MPGEMNVNIDNWEKFLENNDNALTLLNECSVFVTDALSYTSNLIVYVDGLKTLCGKLKKSKITVPDIEPLVNECNNLVAWFNEHNTDVVVALHGVEDIIANYNKSDVDRESVLNKWLDKSSECGLYWALYYGFKFTKFTSLHYITNAMVYATDLGYENGDFVVGDTVTAIFGNDFSTALEANLRGGYDFAAKGIPQTNWGATGMGTLAVMGYNAIKYIANDEGIMTKEDWERLFYNSVTGGGEYLMWTATEYIGSVAVYEALVAGGVAGSWAGPVGMAVGALIATGTVYVLHPFVTKVGDRIVGDDIIDDFYDDNGVFREIPRNGNGKYGTYDVILERTEAIYCQDTVTPTDKITMYRNLNESGYRYLDDDYSTYESDKFNKFLKDVAKAENKGDLYGIAREYGYDISGGTVVPVSSYNDPTTGTDYSLSGLYDEMDKKGFDINEYYAYTHDDYSYIAEHNKRPEIVEPEKPKP